MWTILMFIVIGMVAGWVASLLIRREKYPIDWGVLFIIGVAGSVIAGISSPASSSTWSPATGSGSPTAA